MPWRKRFDADDALSRARAVFWEQGYTATSVQDLVDHMGINRASLYDTFGDKHALFLNALTAYDREYRARWMAELDGLPSPREAVRRLFHDWVDAVEAGQFVHGCFLVNTALERAPHDDRVRDHVRTVEAAIYDFLRRKLMAARERGEVPATVDPDGAAPGLLAGFMGVLALARSGTDTQTLRAAADSVLEQLGPR